MNKEGEINYYLQNKENFFVKSMLDNLDNKEYDVFMNIFHSKSDTNVKR
jgi:hypothetical protein